MTKETVPCPASPRWGAAHLAAGAQWVGIGAPSSGYSRESFPFLPALAQPLGQAASQNGWASNWPLKEEAHGGTWSRSPLSEWAWGFDFPEDQQQGACNGALARLIQLSDEELRL